MRSPANREPPRQDDLCAPAAWCATARPASVPSRGAGRSTFGARQAVRLAVAALAISALGGFALGQGPFQALAPPAPLPSPPAIDRFLFQLPWSLATAAALFVLAIIMARAAALMQAGKRGPLRGAAAALLLAAVAVGIAQALVTTKSEAIRQRTEQLVDAVARGDLTTLGTVLAGDATAIYFDAPGGIDKDTIIDRVSRQFGQGRQATVRIAELSAVADNERFGRSHLRVVITHDLTAGYPLGSWWAVDWRLNPGGAWDATEIRALGITDAAR